MRTLILLTALFFFFAKAQSQELYDDKGVYTIDRKYTGVAHLFFFQR